MKNDQKEGLGKFLWVLISIDGLGICFNLVKTGKELLNVYFLKQSSPQAWDIEINWWLIAFDVIRVLIFIGLIKRQKLAVFLLFIHFYIAGYLDNGGHFLFWTRQWKIVSLIFGVPWSLAIVRKWHLFQPQFKDQKGEDGFLVECFRFINKLFFPH